MEVSLVFEDVSDEYSQISMILDRFEEWRKNDFDTYKDTYFSLCLPKVCVVPKKVFPNIVISHPPHIGAWPNDSITFGHMESVGRELCRHRTHGLVQYDHEVCMERRGNGRIVGQRS